VSGTLSRDTVLVTGASKNIGKAIALAFGRAGKNVAVHARASADEAQAVADEINNGSGQAIVTLGDVGNPADCARIVDEAEEAFGGVDYLVASAARRRFQSYLDITPEIWDETLKSNLSSLFYLSRLVLPGMKERGFGRVIAIGGPDGYLGWHHRAHNVTAKAGLTGLIKAISFEFGYHGVTANIVVPGATQTSRDPEDYPADMLQQSDVPQGAPIIMVPRTGTPAELADACLYLASDEASYVTGQSLQVNGGMVMQ
jgi:NAD(P)-dependent dehydrogenase (short-subunit alcohol dehydrogenase family)